jgi:hypothetical protein
MSIREVVFSNSGRSNGFLAEFLEFSLPPPGKFLDHTPNKATVTCFIIVSSVLFIVIQSFYDA